LKTKISNDYNISKDKIIVTFQKKEVWVFK
jgi:hypothetical protein